MAATRPIFRRHDDFVVVLPLRLSSEVVLEPGTELSFRDYPTYRLWAWYRRRRIAKAGCAWANRILEGRFPGTVQQELPLDLEPEQDKPDALAEPEEEVSQDEEPELELLPELSIERKGSWIDIYQDGICIDRVRGQKALDDWMTENGYGSETL